MRQFFQDLVEYMSSENYEYEHFNDQAPFNRYLADGKISVDYYSRLFWSAWADLANGAFIGTRYPPDPSVYPESTRESEVIPWELYPPLGHHTLLGQVPVAIHLNGPDKSEIDAWWGRLWWQVDGPHGERFRSIVRDRMERGVVRIAQDGEEGYEIRTMRELCPTLEIWDLSA